MNILVVVAIALVLILGFLAILSAIVEKGIDLKAKLEEYSVAHGWMGVVGAVLGAFGTVKLLLNIDLLSHAPLTYLSILVMLVALMGIGFIAGLGTIKPFIKKEEVTAKLDEFMAKVSPFRGLLGLVAVAAFIVALFAIYFLAGSMFSGGPR